MENKYFNGALMCIVNFANKKIETSKFNGALMCFIVL
jgi:hypothetical protein